MFKLIGTILSLIGTQMEKLSQSDSSGKPIYKDKTAMTAAASAVLEGVSIATGFPGVGSAIGIILGAVLRDRKNLPPRRENVIEE